AAARHDLSALGLQLRAADCAGRCAGLPGRGPGNAREQRPAHRDWWGGCADLWHDVADVCARAKAAALAAAGARLDAAAVLVLGPLGHTDSSCHRPTAH